MLRPQCCRDSVSFLIFREKQNQKRKEKEKEKGEKKERKRLNLVELNKSKNIVKGRILLCTQQRLRCWVTENA